MAADALLVLTWLAVLGPAEAARPAAPPRPAAKKAALNAATARQVEATLATQLRTFVLAALPDPLFRDERNWGKQRKNLRGKMKNDGRWHRLRIAGRNLSSALQLEVRNFTKSPGKTVFTVVVGLPAVVELERQTWKTGLRLYSGSTRARLKVVLTLICEVQTRVEKTDNWIPDLILRFRIAQSAFAFDDLVVEHTAGVGGEAAEILGDMLISLVKAAKPNLERDLIAKVNAAVLKAGQAKEVRISLTDLISGKSAPPTAKPAPAKPAPVKR